MIDLNALVNQSLANIEESGFVKEVIQKRIEKTVTETIDELLRGYSPFGKALKSEIESKLQVNFKELDIASYNQVVLNAVKEKLDQAVYVQGVEQIKASMDAMLSDIKPEYKLSEIIEKLKECAEDDAKENDWSEISFHIDADRSVLAFVYFDEEPGKEKYRCKYRLSICKDGRLNTVEIRDCKLDNRLVMGRMSGMEELMFKLYAHKPVIIIDENHVETEYSSEYDD